MDDECSVCCLLEGAFINLFKIADYIDRSCIGTKKKQDFGLDKSFIMRELGSIQQMQRFHEFFHSTGKALNDTENVIDSLSTDSKPKRFRKPE